MKSPGAARPSRLAVLLAMGGLGLSAVMTQLALMRELLQAFTGNELELGIGLGSWFLLTGAGTAAGRWAPRLARPGRALASGQVLIALLPLAQVLAVRAGRDLVFAHGAAASPLGAVLGTTAVMAPYCIVSGAMLATACHTLSEGAARAAAGWVYLADSLGSVGGGVLFSFVLLPRLDHLALLCVPACLNLLLAAGLAWQARAMAPLAAAVAAGIGLAAAALLGDADQWSTALQHPGQKTLLRINSPYGRLVVTEESGQTNFFENGVPLFSTGSVEQIEETVHYPMSQRPDARRVLLICGGAAGTAREILRYGVPELTYAEIDPAIIEAARRFLPENLADPRIRIAMADGRRFLQQTRERFGVVIVGAAEPSTSQLNRFYTAEFFAEAKRALEPEGVLAIASGRYENYVSPELARVIASTRRTLRRSFANVLMIPGGRVYFLASDGPLEPDIGRLIERDGIATRLVNRHYLGAMLAPDRRADLERAASQPAEVNTDFSPVLYYYFLRHWLSQFPRVSGLLGAAMLALTAAYLARLKAVPRIVFASGFTAASLQVVLLLAFQTLYGSLYSGVGLLVTAFMAGLAAGAGWANRRAGGVAPAARSGLILIAAVLALAAAAAPPLLRQLAPLDAAAGTSLAGEAALLALTFGLAAAVGAQFPLATAAEPGPPGRAASAVYTADFAGAALGALLVSTVLIPLGGVTAVCLLTAGLNLVAAALACGGTPGAWGSSTPSA